MANFNYTYKTYSAVANTDSSFKNPRQKMWGVFVRGNTDYTDNYWELVSLTNDIEEAKNKVNEWLTNPPTGQYIHTGINNVILIEIIPTDNNVINP